MHYSKCIMLLCDVGDIQLETGILTILMMALFLSHNANTLGLIHSILNVISDLKKLI